MQVRSQNARRILVSGGAGFIGSAFIRYTLQHEISCSYLLNLDLLTYAADLDNLQESALDPRYHFVLGDILDQDLVSSLCEEHFIDTIVHFAAQTHVDRSIASPELFFNTNCLGTLALLEVVRLHPHIHFHHISTDEVFGSLAPHASPFSEISSYHPNSPYSASKAAADHAVGAYTQTYNLSTTLSYCTNNYGPCQHREKLIPKILSCLMSQTPIPIYGTGTNVRDWLFVDDHIAAIWEILHHKEKGETYAIGGHSEMTNIDLTHLIIHLFAQATNSCPTEYDHLITFVQDRKGHDLRYAINSHKIKSRFHWRPQHTLVEGLRKTIAWYLAHPERLLILETTS